MKIGMLFPGYPSQYVGMGKELYDASRTMQEYFEEASHCLGMNFVKLCFASSDADIKKVHNAYPALFLQGIAIAHTIQDLFPDMLISGVAGYGVGEYCALHVTNAITAPDGLYFLKKFAQFYDEIETSNDALLDELQTIGFVGLSDKQVKALLKDHKNAHLAASESSRMLVSGTHSALDPFIEQARAAGARRIKRVEAVEGYHTPALKELAKKLSVYLTKIDFFEPEFRVLSGNNGAQMYTAKDVERSVMRQIEQPQNWKAVVEQFADYDLLLVPGPSKQLVKELAAVYPDKMILGIETIADIRALQAIVQSEAAQEFLEFAY